VQLARREGAATVVGLARGEGKLAVVRRLGAGVAVDYTVPGWTEAVRASLGGAGVEVAFDSVGGAIGRGAFDLLADGAGQFLIFGFASGEWVDVTPAELFRRGLTLIGFGPGRTPGPAWAADARGLETEALALGAAGELVPLVGQSFPLARAAEAHAAVESRDTTGKTLLIP
jgi:NADPH2:quinone reductase